MKKSTFGFLLFSLAIGCSISLMCSNNVINKVNGEEKVTLNLSEGIVNLYNNNLNDISTPLFNYGIRHGALNIGDKTGIIPGCYKFDKKGIDDKYIYSSNELYKGYISEEGKEYHFSDYDGLIFEIKANEDLLINTSILSDYVLGNVEECEITYFVSNNYNEDSLNWIGNDARINNIKLFPNAKDPSSRAKKDSFKSIIKLSKGYTFYWEFSWNWYQERILNIKDTGFIFEISKNNYIPKELAVENHSYMDMITNVTAMNGNDVTPIYPKLTTLLTYGFRHGSVKENKIEKFDKHAPNILGSKNDGLPLSTFMENWRFNSVDGDGAIVYLKAEKECTLNISRGNFGNDIREGMSLNIYLNNSLVKTEIFDGKNDTLDQFSFTCALKPNDFVYWEIIHYDVGFSIISMGDDGNDHSTLPTFSAVETTDVYNESFDNSGLINGIKNTNALNLKNKGATISAYQGSVKFNNLNQLNYVTTDGGRLFNKDTGVKINYTPTKLLINNSSLTFKIAANINLVTKLNFALDIIDFNNISIRAFKFDSTFNKTKQLFDITIKNYDDIKSISDYFILNYLDILYIEFYSNSLTTIDYFTGLTFIEKCNGDSFTTPYPLYPITDYSSKTNFTHSELAFETGKRKGKAIDTNDFSIQLMTGKVNEDKGDKTIPFSNILYDDGAYLESSSQATVRLTGRDSSFDGPNYAAVEHNRIKTSTVGHTIYKIIAKENMAIYVNHPDCDGGWIDESGRSYIAFYQSNGTDLHLIKRTLVESGYMASDAFAYTFNLAKGDIGYVCFEEDVAEQRNLNIQFNFKEDINAYNEEARKEIFGKVSLNVEMQDVITDMMNNDCNAVIYEDTVKIDLLHGDVKEPKKFLRSECEGDGSGKDDDALVNGSDGQLLSKFFRWQIRAGVNDDNSIMIFIAMHDLKLNLTHEATKDSWASSSSFKYYIADTDGFLDLKNEKYVAKDLPDDYFGYEAHLKEGQSLVVVYSSNDPNTFGVVDLCWKMHASTVDFNPTLVNDFTEGRRIQSIKDSYLELLQNKVSSLNRDDYSISNWSKIDIQIPNYIKNVESLNNEEEIKAVYDECVTQIQSVKTLEQEKEELNKYKENSINEAKEYMLSKNLTDESKEEANDYLTSFEYSVNKATTINEVKIALIGFKVCIDELPVIIDRTPLILGIVISVVSVAAIIALSIFIYNKKEQKKIRAIRSISALKYINDVDYLLPHKGIKRKRFASYMKRSWPLYLMLLPMIIYLFIFSYIPMGGLSLAFKDFDPWLGIWESPWASTDGVLDLGKHFKEAFANPLWWDSFGTTLKINALRLFVGFFIPIIITILLTEIKSKRFSKGFQIISYLPHFISWIVIYGILIALQSQGSPFQAFICSITGKELSFFSDPQVFLWLVIFTNIWKEAGWSTIIYFAAVASINPELYEAANIDGASRWKKILKVTLPGLIPAISINLILQASGFVYGGFDQIFALTANATNKAVLPYVYITDILLYKQGITGTNVEFATIIGLFNSAVSFVLVLISNFVIKKIGGDGIW